MMLNFITVLYISYIVVGAYCAGLTAHEVDNESLWRLLKWIFAWPYLIYKDLKNWRPKRD